MPDSFHEKMPLMLIDVNPGMDAGGLQGENQTGRGIGTGGLESPPGAEVVLCSTKEHFNESLKSVPPNVLHCGTCPCAVNTFRGG